MGHQRPSDQHFSDTRGQKWAWSSIEHFSVHPEIVKSDLEKKKKKKIKLAV